MNFNEIESILGFDLPSSARRHRAWWANENRGSHSHARYGWLAGGFRVVGVDLERESVTFVRAPRSRAKKRIEISSPQAFEEFARHVLEDRFGVRLQSRGAHAVPKAFDFVSADSAIVGDAKYFTMVRGRNLPYAKFSVIAEHVWLLEKLGARKKFLVFGNDKRVPLEWLKRYGSLVKDVEFYFLSDDGNLTLLNRS